MVAAECGSPDVIPVLLAAGADVDAMATTTNEAMARWTALIFASVHGHVAIVEQLVQAGADVNHVDGRGHSALVHAAWNGQTEVVALLVRVRNIEIESADARGDTALLYAVKFRRFQVFKVLVDASANVHHANRRGETALIHASRRGQLEMVECLLKLRVDLNHTDTSGWTALQHATRGGHDDVVEALLATSQVDVNQANDPRRSSPLAIAAARGHANVIRLLLAYGADLSYPRPDGLTPLMIASRRGDQPSATILLEAGADIHATDPRGYTALLHAVDCDSTRVFWFLREREADVNATARDGRTALALARASPNGRKIESMLLSGKKGKVDAAVLRHERIHIA